MKKLIGQVVSNAMQNTAVVKVDRVVAHPLYRKQYTVSKRYKTENQDNKFKVGDLVRIAESKPYSKDKRFVIEEKVGTAFVREELDEEEVKEAAKIHEEKNEKAEPTSEETEEKKDEPQTEESK